jgi:dienelactone hydrolase
MRLGLIGALLSLCAVGVARAAPPPLDAYGHLPAVEWVQLSPSGERIAYVSASGDQRQLVVRDLQDKVLFSGPVGDQKIREVAWAGDSHLVITLSKTSTVFLQNGRFNGELEETVVVDIDAGKHFGVFKNNPDIFPGTFGYEGATTRDGRWYGFFLGYPLSKTRGFDPTLDSRAVRQLYRVDLDSGVVDVVGRAYGHPSEWAVDSTGAVVAHSDYDETYGTWTLHSGAIGGAALATLKEPLGEIRLEGMGETVGTVLVHKDGSELWTLADGGHRPVFDEPTGETSDFLWDPTTRLLVGAQLSSDVERQVFFEPTLSAKLAALSKAFGRETLIVSWSSDFKRLIAYTDGAGDPGTFWLLDGASAKPYGDTYPDIPDAAVAGSRVVAYKAGDGLEIHGILTLPPGRDPKNLPLVVMPHGGPQGINDTVAFDWWAQAFASRGYAVFKPNYRGSGGHGTDFLNAGAGQWGRKMLTDASDGVAELARQGVIDPKRVCIVGGSYGGYAAMAGVTVQQGLYRCAVSYGGVSDVNALLNKDIPNDDDRSAEGRTLREVTGSKSNGDPAMAAISPARLAARADAPILLMYGTDDSVVAPSQSEEMARSLRAVGKPVELVAFKSEDHWLSRDATRKAVLAASVAFVEKYDPPD